MEKKVLPIIIIAIALFAQIASAQFSITKESVDSVIITELSKNAKFNLMISNEGQNDSFEIYTFVGNVELLPKGFTFIGKDEIKTIPVSVTIDEKARKNYGEYSFAFTVRGQNSGTKEDRFTILLERFRDSFKVSTEDITLNSQDVIINIENTQNYTFENLDVEVSSNLINDRKLVTLKPYETIELKIPLDKSKTSSMIAGTYITSVRISKESATEVYPLNLRYLERTGTATKDEGAGFFVLSRVIEKSNEGNTIAPVEIVIDKDIISRLFTTFSRTPDKVERNNLIITYTWRQELQPGERLRIVINTNWVAPLIIILVIIAAAAAIKIALTRDLNIKKEVIFMKTKGGEFALKVIVKVKASKFVEKIVLIDRLPPLVKLYEKFGQIAPNKIDERTRRMEWQIENLQAEEERIFTYLIYSKISPIGKYELPTAMAVYERNGAIHESQSNTVFFLAEQVPVKNENE